MAVSYVATPSGAELAELRAEVRAVAASAPSTCDSWLRAFDPAFSAELGRRGWIGLTIPARYGGHERGSVVRYVVTEELLRAGAPVAYHWFADRQIAPTLLAAGNERLREELLPRIARGSVCVCIGISEPNAGSDVAAIATTASRDGGGWRVNGQKVWTTGAMHADYCYLVARTSRGEKRHHGLSEFVVPMDTPGIIVRPIEDLVGEAHFAEIFFEDALVEDWRLVGEVDHGFAQIVRQLDYERSGPERFLSTLPLLDSLIEVVRREDGAPALVAAIGELLARLTALRSMAFAVACAMDAGAPPSAESALVKDLRRELRAGRRVACAGRARRVLWAHPPPARGIALPVDIRFARRHGRGPARHRGAADARAGALELTRRGAAAPRRGRGARRFPSTAAGSAWVRFRRGLDSAGTWLGPGSDRICRTSSIDFPRHAANLRHPEVCRSSLDLTRRDAADSRGR